MDANYFIGKNSFSHILNTNKRYTPNATDKYKMERLIRGIDNNSYSNNFSEPQDLLLAKKHKDTQRLLDQAIEYQDWVLNLPIDRQVYVVFGWHLAENMLTLNNMTIEQNAEYWK